MKILKPEKKKITTCEYFVDVKKYQALVEVNSDKRPTCLSNSN